MTVQGETRQQKVTKTTLHTNNQMCVTPLNIKTGQYLQILNSR